jgi:hypothetical protein
MNGETGAVGVKLKEKDSNGVLSMVEQSRLPEGLDT